MKDISSRDNPLVKKLRLLAASARACREQGETVLDGAHLLAAALDRQWPLQAMVVSASGAEQEEIAALLARAGAGLPCFRLPDRLFAQLSPVDSPSGVLTLAAMPPPLAVPASDCDWLVLDGVQDPGNLGSILRTAAAAGITEVLLGPGCAGVWSPRVLRAGMGAHFVLRLHEVADLPAALAAYPGKVLATALSARAQDLYATELRSPCAWLFGAEGRGLSPALRACAGLEVMIPLAVGTESLNVGAAVAVCLFEQLRQRRAAGALAAKA